MPIILTKKKISLPTVKFKRQKILAALKVSLQLVGELTAGIWQRQSKRGLNMWQELATLLCGTMLISSEEA